MAKVSLLFCVLLGLLVHTHAHSHKSEKSEKIGFYELKKGSMRVNLTNYGASIVAVYVPDKHGLSCFIFFHIYDPLFHINTYITFFFLFTFLGKVADVVLGYDSIEQYEV